MTTPSNAAMRAATEIIKTVLPFNQRTQDRIVVIAEIIDRETKLPELVEVANEARDQYQHMLDTTPEEAAVYRAIDIASFVILSMAVASTVVALFWR